MGEERVRERELPCPASLHKWPQWSVLGQAKAISQELHLHHPHGHKAKVLLPFSTALPGHDQGARTTLEQAGCKLVPVRSAGVTDVILIHHTSKIDQYLNILGIHISHTNSTRRIVK